MLSGLLRARWKWSLKQAEWLLSRWSHLFSLTTDMIWLVYITYQAFTLSKLGAVNLIFSNYRSLSFMFWILRWWALWKAAHQRNQGAYVNLTALVGIQRRQIQALGFFRAPCSFQRCWPAPFVFTPGFNPRTLCASHCNYFNKYQPQEG